MFCAKWMSVVSLRLQIRSCLWERDKKSKIENATWLKKRVDIWIHFSSFQCLSGFVFATLEPTWSRREGPRIYWGFKISASLKVTGGLEWTSRLGRDFPVEISRVHDWARPELLFLTLDPGGLRYQRVLAQGRWQGDRDKKEVRERSRQGSKC